MDPRSYLFVPGHRPERFDKAIASGADAVVVDLEDAVAPDDKARARVAVTTWLGTLPADTRATVVVRINDATTPWFDDDLAMLQAARATAVMLPKAEHAGTVARVRAACPGIAVLALIETARGVLNAPAIAAADGVQRLVFGTIDFALELGLSGDPAGFDHAAAALALASRAAGLAPPVAGVTPEIDDAPRLVADLAHMRAHGFNAKLCIHPRQIQPLHAALRPDPAEIAWANRVLAATTGHDGAVQVDGRMVDRPVIERARAVLARAQR